MMTRVRLAPASARRMVVLFALLASVWLAGMVLAWGTTVATTAPGPAAGGATSPPGPAIQAAPQRWKLAPLDMA